MASSTNNFDHLYLNPYSYYSQSSFNSTSSSEMHSTNLPSVAVTYSVGIPVLSDASTATPPSTMVASSNNSASQSNRSRTTFKAKRVSAKKSTSSPSTHQPDKGSKASSIIQIKAEPKSSISLASMLFSHSSYSFPNVRFDPEFNFTLETRTWLAQVRVDSRSLLMNIYKELNERIVMINKSDHALDVVIDYEKDDHEEMFSSKFLDFYNSINNVVICWFNTTLSYKNAYVISNIRTGLQESWVHNAIMRHSMAAMSATQALKE